MKIYNPTPNKVLRLQITKSGEKTEYVNICESTIEEAVQYLSDILQGKASILANGKRTRIDIREALGGKNGISKSVSFFGLSTTETKDIILNSFN